MSKKDFNKGMEAGAKPFEEKFHQISEDTRKIGEKVNEKLDNLGNVMDAVIDDLSDMQKKELYHLNTPYDLKEDLDEDEKEILAALLLRLSEFTENNEYQKKFIRSVNAYIDIKSPQMGIDISCIENIESINSQRIILQTAMEYLYLACEDFSVMDDLEDEVFEHFSVNRKGVREIKGYIEAVYQAAGKDGIAEKYGFVPEEKAEEASISEEIFKLYKETTPYDLMEDLSYDDEAGILCRILIKMREVSGENEYQKKFITMLSEKAEISLDMAEDTELEIDDIEDMESQKIILQVAMEYGFLGSGDFEFLERDMFDDFSVNKRGIRQIKELIQKVYEVKGYEGLIEKYDYMGIKEIKRDEVEEEEQEEGKCLEISQVCADRVNAQTYAELDEYLVYLEEQEKNAYYKVHKLTGECKLVWKNSESKNIFAEEAFCGAGDKIYIFAVNERNTEKYILEINVDTGEEKRIDFVYAEGSSVFGTSLDTIKPQCSRKYLIYNTTVQESGALVCVNLKTFASTVLTNNNKIPFYAEEFYLMGNLIYIIPREYSSNLNENMLYCCHLSEGKLEELGEMFEDEKYKLLSTWYKTSLYKQEHLMLRSKIRDNVLSLVCKNLDDIKQSSEQEISISDKYDLNFFDEVWVFGKYVFMITEDENGEIWSYDFLEKKMSLIVEDSKGVHTYTEGIIFKETKHSIFITGMQLIGDTLYYRAYDEVYKVSIKERQHTPERL